MSKGGQRRRLLPILNHAGEGPSGPTLDGVSFPTIDESLRIWLEREFEEEEVKFSSLRM